MASYVLVHGGFGGGWTWRDFAPLLRNKGHEVYTPTLTGLGERVHLGTPDTNLSTHIQDILNVIEYEDLRAVILAGHSYGGMVITGVADRIPERIAHLVYIDAEVPRDGESEADATGKAEWPEWTKLWSEEGWRLVMKPVEGLTPQEARWRSRWVSQPRQTFEEKIRLTRPTEEQPFTRTFVAASESGAPKGISRVKDNPAWRYVEIQSRHRVHRDAPEQLGAILLELAVHAE